MNPWRNAVVTRCLCLTIGSTPIFDTVQIAGYSQTVNINVVEGSTSRSVELPGVQSSSRPHPEDPAQTLRRSGVQVTAQRIAVLKAISTQPHATAEELTESVRQSIGTISRQSVYDALSALEQAGLVRRIQPIGSPARFEDRVGDNHHHIICRNCGALADVDCAIGSAPCLTASNSHGFEIDEADVAYWGRCPNCQESSTH